MGEAIFNGFYLGGKIKEKSLDFSLEWPELESNQRHKDFQSSQVIAIPCLWLPQINQDSPSLQENFNLFHDLLEVEGEQ
jgi:hypothetical protein